MRAPAALACALFAASQTSGCVPRAEDDGILQPVHRFVQGAPRAPATSPLTADLPSATIRDDTRFVLAAPPSQVIIWRRDVPVPEDGRLVVSTGLRGAFKSSNHILAVPQLKLRGEWQELPPRIVATRKTGAGTSVRVKFALPPAMGGQRIGVSVLGYVLDAAERTEFATPPVSIPPEAVLELAIGILEPAWNNGPVEFVLRACEGDACETLLEHSLDPADPQQRGWHDLRIPVGNLAGSVRELRFETRRHPERGAFSFPVWANPTLYVPAPRPAGAPNLILLSIDTLRADHLSCYGYEHDTSPFIDERLARGGSLFEQTVAAATITTPSHMTMFTALQPATHGTTDGMKVLPPSIVTMSELIWAAGIDTAAFTEDGWLGARHGFSRGFASYAENKSADIMAPEGQVDVTFDGAKRWLARNRGKRFFLFLHTFQVHDPYAPPARYRELFASRAGAPIDGSSPAHLRAMADYDREIRYTDDELRSLFATLDELDLSRNTVFVLTSDHGEEFLDHGRLGHGSHMHEEAVRVPLLFYGPGIAAGARFANPVGHADLMPTILEILGVPVPEPIEGRSLLGLLRGGTGPPERALFSESWAPLGKTAGSREQDVGVAFLPPAYSVRRGFHKLSRYRTEEGFRYELFDLESDPGERVDLYASGGTRARELTALLDDYERNSQELRRRLDRAAGVRSDAASPQTQLDPQQEEKLRALGYIE